MGERPRILIVDDDRAVLFVLEYSLARFRDVYEIVTAQSGEDAMESAREGPLALLITDIRMPGMDGVDLTRAVRDLAPTLPVVWITAHGSANLLDAADELSVCRCLDKPLEVPQIRQAALDALGTVLG